MLFACNKETSPTEKEGCTDPNAMNFNSTAVISNNACNYCCDVSFESGNLKVENGTSYQLALYNDNKLLYRIDSLCTFWACIENKNEVNLPLRIYKLRDVLHDIYNPNPDLVFKKWDVSIDDNCNTDEYHTWNVDTLSYTGSLLLTYYEGTDYYVDVYLNSRNGPKIAELVPGVQNKEIKLDYGIYELLYHYWWSDISIPDGMNSVGWITEEVINNEREPILISLNHTNRTVSKIIPHWTSTDTLSYGNLKVVNESGQAVEIYANGSLIETIAFNSDTNTSLVPANSEYIYTIPAGAYELSAISVMTTETVTELSTNINAGEVISWVFD